MTRINCIPVYELVDKHLVAEYREIGRLAKHAAQKYASKPQFEPPATYRLGKGHMDFFVDKGLWLANRHSELVAEMRKRGFTVNFPDYPAHIHPMEWLGDWEPTEEAMEINRKRIKERLEK
jgi:deoxyribonuclease (pyrimidine dimer)